LISSMLELVTKGSEFIPLLPFFSILPSFRMWEPEINQAPGY
ncbi:hypothetical protein LCGC14_2094530, partial [marine sediment metagenome]